MGASPVESDEEKPLANLAGVATEGDNSNITIPLVDNSDEVSRAKSLFEYIWKHVM